MLRRLKAAPSVVKERLSAAGGLTSINNGGRAMHKDEAKGAGKQAKGALKDAAGGLTGNEKLQAEGKMDKAEGKLQQKVGQAKEGVRDALKH